MIYTAEVTVHSGSSLTTLYLSSHPFVTKPSDSPSNISFECRLVDPVLIKLSAFENSLTGGSSTSGVGEISVSNVDNVYGYLANYGFDGRSVVVRVGEVGTNYPADFTTILSGTMISPRFDKNRLTIRVRDNQELLNSPLLTTKYAGTNALPAGLEGVPTDISGKVKPRVYGKVYNVSPPLVNTSRLIYQVSDLEVLSVDQVYDRGATLTKGANYTSQSDMETNAPLAGNFRVWPAGGYFRLGSSPSGQITADVVQGASAADRTCAKILNSLATTKGLSVSASDVTALDAFNSSEMGVFVDSEDTVSKVMDEIANSIGVWFGVDSTGTLRIGYLDAPSGTPDLYLTEDTYSSIDLLSNSDTSNGVPLYRVKLSYGKFYTVQTSDLAGSVSNPRKGELSNEYRAVATEDVSVKTKHPLAEEHEIQSLLVSSVSATTEASRVLALHKVRRDRVVVRIFLDQETLASIKLMGVARITSDFLDYQSGRDFRILGYTIDTKRMVADLVLWG